MVLNDPKNSGMAELFKQYQAGLKLHLSLKMNMAADDAEEVVQETFIRLMKKESDCSGKIARLESPRAYIFQTATNLAIDRFRHQRARFSEEHREPLSPSLVSEQPDPVKVIDSQRRLQQLVAVIDQLPPKCRKVFILHKFKQLSYKEVAEHLNISSSMVEKHMMKALDYCDKQLGKELYNGQ